VPLKVLEVGVRELYEVLKSFWSRGYKCLADENGDWECVRRVNEVQDDRVVVVLREKA
jgi:hypothetical protein